MDRFVTVQSKDGKEVSPFFKKTKLSELAKVDVVCIALSRGSSCSASQLHAMTMAALVAHAAQMGNGGEASRVEAADAAARAARRAALLREMGRDGVARALRVLGLPCSGSAERQAQELLDAGGADAAARAAARAARSADASQDAAVEAALRDARTLIIAGPGAGKTTTLARLAVTAAAAGQRVLVVAFNRGARAVMLERVRTAVHALGLNAPLLSKSQATQPGAPGVLVMTFDEFVYAFRAKHNGGCAGGSYDAAFEAGLRLPPHAAEACDLLVVDEAQDVQPKHAQLIAQVRTRARRVAVAGDPRQELYPGATWFSALVAAAKGQGAWTVCELAHNHRGEPGVVAAINAASRALFETLHYDQRPSAAAGAEGAFDTQGIGGFERLSLATESGFGGALRCVVVERGRVGAAVAELLLKHPPSETMALAPVTLEKWSLASTVHGVRQAVYAAGSDAPVLTLGDGVVLDDTAYFLGTARTAKGTERDHVVVFASSVDYTSRGVISREAFHKMLFVCLSRARKSCTLVFGGPPPADFCIAPVLPPQLPRACPAERTPPATAFAITVTDAAKLPIWGRGMLEAHIAAAKGTARKARPELPLAFEPDARYTRPRGSTQAEPDADVVGLAVEAALAHHAGFDLARIRKIRPARVEGGQLREAVGLAGAPDGCFDVVFDPRRLRDGEAVQDFVASLRTLIADCAASNAPYLAVVLQRSAEIGAVWTVSRRLMSPALLARTLPWCGALVYDAAGFDEDTWAPLDAPAPENNIKKDDTENIYSNENNTESSDQGQSSTECIILNQSDMENNVPVRSDTEQDGDESVVPASPPCEGGVPPNAAAEVEEEAAAWGGPTAEPPEDGDGRRLVYQRAGTHTVRCHRSPAAAGWVTLRTDFEVVRPGDDDEEIVDPQGGRSARVDPQGDRSARVDPQGGRSARVDPQGGRSARVDPQGARSERVDPQGDRSERVEKVIEIKHTSATKPEALAQACVYACVRGAPAVVLNTAVGELTDVPPLPPGALDLRLRAYFALRAAQAAQNLLASRGRSRKVAELARDPGRLIVALDIEGGLTPEGESLITEVGAVCFRFSEQERVLDCFHRVAAGCREVAPTPGDEDEGFARTGRGAGTEADPWVPFGPAALGATSLPALRADQGALRAEFAAWLRSLGGAPLLVQWAGADTARLGVRCRPCGDEAPDAAPAPADEPVYELLDARRAYRAHLAATGAARVSGTRLGDAVAHLLGPDMPFAPHRAFEDATLTAAVLVAIHHNGGAL